MLRNGLEPTHLLIVAAVIILVFGGKKLPELARGMGQGLRIFKTELRASETDAAAKPAPVESIADVAAPTTAEHIAPTPAPAPEKPTA